MRCLDKRTIALDLCRHSFVPHYEVWVFHNESTSQAIEEEEDDDYSTVVDRMDEMLEEIQPEFIEDPLTLEVESFFKLLKASEDTLPEHTKVTLTAFMIWLMAIKS
jgi:hypothetical protein